MKSPFTLLLLLLFLHFSTFASQPRKVLLIGIDGCRSDALQQAATPNIDGLLANSLYSLDSWHTGITFSGPSWTTLLTGVQWNKHGVTGNTFTVTNFNQYPAFPKRAKEIKPNLTCVEVVEWDPLADNFYNDGWDKKIKVADGSTFPTADSAIIQLQDTALDVLFTYFDHVDLTGHSTTFSPSNAAYIAAIEQVDSAIGMVLSALYARPDYANEDWLILLITDHGGNSFFHGGNSDEERHIWWIANGSAVAHEQINAADPGTYNCQLIAIFDTTCVDYNLMRQSPTHPDIAVTAIHHLIFDTGVNPETKVDWELDGKSWLALPPNAIAERDTNSTISVFPNPASHEISVFSEVPVLEAELLDMLGNKMNVTPSTLPANNFLIALDQLAAGCYLLQVQTGKGRSMQKISVMR